MTSQATRQFLAGLAIAQRLGRPHTPTDQAWIESLFGHVKAEWPHLEQLADPAVLDTELARVRDVYNGTRLHAGIGYVTPDDEHARPRRQPSAKHASRASGEPTNSGSPTIAGTATTTTPEHRHDLDHFPSQLRG